MLTTSVRAKRTRPEAIRALTARPEDSGKVSAMFEAIVDGFADEIRFGETLPEAEHRGGDDRRLAERQDGEADHLPARGAERERALLQAARRLLEHRARDR